MEHSSGKTCEYFPTENSTLNREHAELSNEGLLMTIATLEDAWITRNSTTDGTRVTYSVRAGDTVNELWFEAPAISPDDLAYDRADSVLIVLLPFLLRNGFERFNSKLPISETLYYNLTHHVIPQLVISKGSTSRKLEISAPITKETFDTTGVAAGMSLGIDSFATLSEYSRNSSLPNYRITHFSYFNIGAHHGTDVLMGRSPLTRRELFEGQRAKVREFCKLHDYPLLELDSNLSQFLRRTFGKTLFNRSHTYRNVAAALLFQKIIGTYYYSSAFNLDLFRASLRADSASYEKWLLPLLSNDNMSFYNSNKHWRRLEKTKIVSDLPESYDYLNVCLIGVDNCGRCRKCRKTLMALDVLGESVLERYSNVFDLEQYVKHSRQEWFGSIYSYMADPGLPGLDMKDIFNEGLKNGYRHFPEKA